MKVSDYIALDLHKKGVRHVFELSGGMITHLLDSLHKLNAIDVISVRHEQAAAFAADACGRMTGIPGVAMATSGPGAINLLTGIGSCHFDSSPAVFITGQVNRNEQKKSRAIRQLGFQETDIVTMAGPVTKASWRIEEPSEVPEFLDRAFCLAVSGRPGPVLIDIPMDIQRMSVDAPHDSTNPELAHPPTPSGDDALMIANAVRAAKRPIILIGGGIRAGRCVPLLRALVDLAAVPVVHSLMAVDVLPFGHPLRMGLIGSYGNRWANMALSKADVLLVLGSRLDVRQTGSEVEAFKANRTIFHVDCEPGELNNRITGCRTVLGELQSALPVLIDSFQQATSENASTGWLGEIAALQCTYPDTAELIEAKGINPNVFMHQLSALSHDASAFVVDVGQHQMWAAQSLELGATQRFLTCGGMGAMGFALPAAVGAALSCPGKPVVVIAGDGGFQCNIQELQTAVHHKLPLRIIVLNNHCHGMVRQFQESYFESRYQSTYWGYSAPNFERVARAYGLASMTVTDSCDAEAALAWLKAPSDGPKLLQVMVDLHTNVYPKIAFGRPISDMEPLAQPTAMEST
jgi:acetolactate synthase I/II/III large subunit